MASMRRALVAISALIPLSIAESCWQGVPCSGPTEAAFPGEWDSNIFAPSSRTVSPSQVIDLGTAQVLSPYPGASSIKGNASALVFDFGKEVGGIATVEYTTSGGAGQLGLAFTEAKNWIGLASDSSNGQFSRGYGDQACDDGAIYDYFTTDGKHTYTMPLMRLRGGFRYMTLFLLTNNTAGSMNIDSVSLAISFSPTWSNLHAYQGYFHSNDDLLNKIWYSGAYTLQTDLVATNEGRQFPFLTSEWANNATLANGTIVIVDGAKRDREIWPGDMGIAVPSSFYSLGPDLDAVKNALQAMYDYQNSDGSFPEAGPPLLQQDSDTYHCWTMIGTYNYVFYTNDTTFLSENFEGYIRAMDYIYDLVLEPLGLLNVTGTRDWGRESPAGYCSEANMILYRTLTTGAELASWAGNDALASEYSSRASMLQKNIMAYLYDFSYGAFNNNVTSEMHPQDANSMSLAFGVVSANSSEGKTISERLTDNWTPIGPDCPELPNNVSPFISGFEVQGHFTVGDTQLGLDLIRTSWGWYLNNPNGSESTVIEGYLTNGSFGYRNYRGYNWDSSYPSHSHGWSSGPTSALTNFVLGLSITGRVGSTWKFAPQFGDLTSVQGGFTTSLGKYQASWNIIDGGRKYTAEVNAPEGTVGEVILPPLPGGGGCSWSWNGQHQGTFGDKAEMRMSGVNGGKHTVIVTKT